MRIAPTAVLGLTGLREQPAAKPAPSERDPAAVVALGEAATAAAQTSSTDPAVTARIATIRELLETGEYVVDLDVLSERILDDDLARSEP